MRVCVCVCVCVCVFGSVGVTVGCSLLYWATGGPERVCAGLPACSPAGWCRGGAQARFGPARSGPGPARSGVGSAEPRCVCRVCPPSACQTELRADCRVDFESFSVCVCVCVCVCVHLIHLPLSSQSQGRITCWTVRLSPQDPEAPLPVSWCVSDVSRVDYIQCNRVTSELHLDRSISINQSL